MKVEYATEKVRTQCTSVKAANKLFGGDKQLVNSLHARINMLISSNTLQDVILYKPCRFHNLENKHGKNLKGYCAIDVKTKKESWRIILQPLTDELLPYESGNIDTIAKNVKVVEIREVSDHYE